MQNIYEHRDNWAAFRVDIVKLRYWVLKNESKIVQKVDADANYVYYTGELAFDSWLLRHRGPAIIWIGQGPLWHTWRCVLYLHTKLYLHTEQHMYLHKTTHLKLLCMCAWINLLRTPAELYVRMRRRANKNLPDEQKPELRVKVVNSGEKERIRRVHTNFAT